ncbi:MAG TPA: metallophosphoesterase [Fimbriimonas sp.]|nr:metallophosphoesterase [Fimbriimonas sp.]
MSSVTRREVLGGAALLGVGALAGHAFASPSRLKKPGFRFAHLTDLHIKGHQCGQSVRRAFRHAVDRPHRPDLIVTGGDLVYDAMYGNERCVDRQWRHVSRAFHAERSVPIEHILGNHDIWGIDRDKSQTKGNEPLYGKKWAMQVLNMPQTYRSFDRGGWHFVLLDDVQALPEQKTYEARLDEAQFQWLGNDLASLKSTTPVIVLSHVPILGASVFFPPQTSQDSSKWALPFSMMHGDAHRIVELFARHPNVKLCLSGHTHLIDKVEYKGVTYLCNGAVSGNWWNGPFQGFPPGYSMIDLFPDGTFSSEFQDYRLAPEIA